MQSVQSRSEEWSRFFIRYFARIKPGERERLGWGAGEGGGSMYEHAVIETYRLEEAKKHINKVCMNTI